MDLENKINDIVQNEIIGNNITIADSADVGKETVNSSKIDDLTMQPTSPRNSNSFIKQNTKMNDSFSDEDIGRRQISNYNSDVNISESIPTEESKQIENQDNKHVSPETKMKDIELKEYISSELIYHDPEPECLKQENYDFGQGEKEYSDTKSFKLAAKEKERSNSSCTSNSKIYAIEIDSDSLFENSKDSNLDVELLKGEKEITTSDIMIMNGINNEIVSERDLSLKKINDGKEKVSSENPTDDIEKNDNDSTDDLKSEDFLDLDKNFSLINNLPKNYIKEVRRLSEDVAKYVIQSARNSVHESKLECLGITPLSEKSTGYDYAKGSQESHFNNAKQHEEDTFQFEGKISRTNFIVNSDQKNIEVKQELDIEDVDTVCGFGCFKPKWIQKFAEPRAFLVLFSIIGVIHGCYYPYVVSIMTTLEKRYAFKTKVSGTLLLADEVTPLILGILVGYFGGKTHRPRMVALGMCMSVICCFISGLPYLIYGTSKHVSYSYDNRKTGPTFCEVGVNSTHCNSDEQPPTLTVVGIFILASFLKGLATISYYVIGLSYMDDIIKRKNSAMYLGIVLSLRLVGPFFGFLMSSGFLKYYENPVYDPGFGPDDPRWIGAWWIGFFLQGILLVIFTIPIALFPRRLPSQRMIPKDADTTSEQGIKEIFRGLISALKRLGRNPVFIVLIFKTTMTIFGHFGHYIMLPKYMENQFRLSASEASLFSGALTITCVIISTLLGGFCIWKFRPRIKVLLSGMILSEIMACVGFLILMVPRCNPSEMLNFGMNEKGLILNNFCNNNCDCSTSAFTPFCGQDGKTLYFSPCYAGCTHDVTPSSTSKVSKEFGNCSCVAQMGTTISEGFCPDENCWNQATTYLIIVFFIVSTYNFFTVAATMILLRSVHPRDKSFALGTFETFICLFGFIPFPITFGALVDSACLVWEKSCDETGNCWFYDMEKYNYLLHGASALFCSLSVVCLITLYFLSSRIRSLYDEEDEVEETKYVDIKLDTVQGSVTKL